MPDAPLTIEIDKEETFHVSVSAHKQSFRYNIDRYSPDGNGGFLPPTRLASGLTENRTRVGTGAELEGSMIYVTVSQGGNTEVSWYEIVVRLVIERENHVYEDVKTWRIPPGLDSGEDRFFAVVLT
jgi:hypothetical protein